MEDRISNLPDEIIDHIGTFLSAKEAAFASLLSKRWRNQFTIIPKLHFDASLANDGESFSDFVDELLALPASSRVRKLTLRCNDVAQFEEHINACLCDVVKRGVFALELDIKLDRNGTYSLPLEVITCKTVAVMMLGRGLVIDLLPEDAFLPALKKIFLDSVRFYDVGGRCAFAKLLSASPVLEELVIDGAELERWKWCCTFSSPSLRRLTIRREEWESIDESDDELVELDCRGLVYDFDSVSFDTPALTYLEYSDYVPKTYPFVNLNSLVEAKLDLWVEVDADASWSDEHADDFNVMNLINGIQNVEILDLTIHTAEMFNAFRESIPVFEKLFQITIGFSDHCWYPLPNLIKKSPNLKTLIIDGSLHRRGYWGDVLVCKCLSEYSFLLACPLEVLKINDYGGSIEELEQMKHILGKLSSLELVEVGAFYGVSSPDKKLQVMASLLMLPRASPKCKIKVKFSPKRY